MGQGAKDLFLVNCLVCWSFTLLITVGDKLEPSPCYYEFRNQSFGILATPLEGSTYETNSSCVWHIEVQDGYRIAISIRSLLLNTGDTLAITEYKTIANSTLINRKVFNKDNRPEDVIFSSSNNVKVEIVQNSNPGDNGLIASLPSTEPSIRMFYAVFEIESCGGLMTTSSGVIEVPTYVHLSMKSHECTWRILAPEDKVISLSFLRFDVGPGSCLFNMLYIRDGLTSLSDLIGSYCEEYPPLGNIRSSSNGLTITYRARPTFLATKLDTIPRIKMLYEFKENCGGQMESFSGTFTSPSSAPAVESPCIWSIKVPKFNHALLTLKSYQMSIVNETGLQENLNIYDGMTSNDSLIWSSSWSKPPPPSLFSSNRQLVVNYSTSDNSSRTVRLKFKISFRAVHERILEADQCKTVGTNRVFQCSENQYIYCHLVCNGIRECENGMDEEQCMVHYSQIDVRETENKAEIGYLILSFALFGSAILACMLVVAIDRLCRSRITTLIKEETSQDTHSRSRRETPHSPSILPSYNEIDLTLDAPPCYEEAVGERRNDTGGSDGSFDIVTGRGFCQSPLSRLAEAEIREQVSLCSPIDREENPDR